ncbi:MAG: hypothetical protein IH988_10295, partial [Planctomycetes bacterium]|nr:hypothetical protein [Planctomycetota bacterium]
MHDDLGLDLRWREGELKRQLAVKTAASGLDFRSWFILSWAAAHGEVEHLKTRTIREAIGNAGNNAAIIRLLEIGGLETKYLRIMPETIQQGEADSAEQLLRYKVTPFGTALL